MNTKTVDARMEILAAETLLEKVIENLPKVEDRLKAIYMLNKIVENINKL